MIRALSLVGEVTLAATKQAEALCRRAIAIAPSYSQAHSLLAWIVVRGTVWSGDIGAVLPQAVAEARMALGLDDRDPWAHIAYGLVLWRMRRPAEAERAFRRALELNPNSALSHAYLGAALADQEIDDEAIGNAEHALRLSPKDRHIGLRASMVIAYAHFGAKHYPDAVRWARDTTEQHPEHVWARADSGQFAA